MGHGKTKSETGKGEEGWRTAGRKAGGAEERGIKSGRGTTVWWGTGGWGGRQVFEFQIIHKIFIGVTVYKMIITMWFQK